MLLSYSISSSVNETEVDLDCLVNEAEGLYFPLWLQDELDLQFNLEWDW